MDIEAKRLAGKRIVKGGFVTVYSDLLNLDFRCPLDDPRACRLENIVSNYELLADQRLRPRKRS